MVVLAHAHVGVVLVLVDSRPAVIWVDYYITFIVIPFIYDIGMRQALQWAAVANLGEAVNRALDH